MNLLNGNGGEYGVNDDVVIDLVQQENIIADSAQITDLSTDNLLVTGTARFTNDIHGRIADSKDINQVTATNAIPDNYYILVSDGAAVKRVKFSDLYNTILTKLSYDPTKTYLTIN